MSIALTDDEVVVVDEIVDVPAIDVVDVDTFPALALENI
tara:strand:+ start:473 stop:589 length:117 start_codon:yes stop_codon:yes gene_type:complete